MEQPLCSIVVATYCGADKLPVLLLSLYRQSIHPSAFEIILVDDGSPEQAAREIDSVCETFADTLTIRVLHLPANGGPARARNAGIAEARGSYIFFTDDDCEVPALWMETHLKVYKNNPKVSCVGGWYRFQKKDRDTNIYAQFWQLHYNAVFAPIDLETYVGISPTPNLNKFAVQNTANLSIRRLVLLAVPGFEEIFVTPGGEDTVFAQQISAAGFISLYIPFYVRHTSSLSFKRFIKVILNRGIAIYIRRERIGRLSFNARNWHEHEWSLYKNFLYETSITHAGIRKNYWKLYFLGKLYYLGVSSNTALHLHKRRWRKRILKRARADARVKVALQEEYLSETSLSD